MKFLKDTRTIKFKEVYSMLLNVGKIKHQYDLARKLGMPTRKINYIMRGRTKVCVKVLAKLYQVFNINMNYIFSKSNVMLITPKDAKSK